MNVVIHPPGTGPHSTSPTLANGRSYTPVPGTPQTVPDQDAAILCANGWLYGHPDILPAVTTANRPTTGLTPGLRVTDTTISKNIMWDGAAWREVVTGGTP